MIAITQTDHLSARVHPVCRRSRDRQGAARRIVNQFGRIRVEDLNLKGLATGMHVKHVNDAVRAQLVSLIPLLATRIIYCDAGCPHAMPAILAASATTALECARDAKAGNSREMQLPNRGTQRRVPSRGYRHTRIARTPSFPECTVLGSNPRWHSPPYRNHTLSSRLPHPAKRGINRLCGGVDLGWADPARLRTAACIEAMRFAERDRTGCRSGASFNAIDHVAGPTTATTASLAASFRLLNSGNIEQRFYCKFQGTYLALSG
jgi:hypothetical protein